MFVKPLPRVPEIPLSVSRQCRQHKIQDHKPVDVLTSASFQQNRLLQGHFRMLGFNTMPLAGVQVSPDLSLPILERPTL